MAKNEQQRFKTVTERLDYQAMSPRVRWLNERGIHVHAMDVHRGSYTIHYRIPEDVFWIGITPDEDCAATAKPKDVVKKRQHENQTLLGL